MRHQSHLGPDVETVGRSCIGGTKVLSSEQSGACHEWEDGGRPAFCELASQWQRMRHQSHQRSCCGLDYIGGTKAPGLDPVGARLERNVGGFPPSGKVAPQELRMRHQRHQSHQRDPDPAVVTWQFLRGLYWNPKVTRVGPSRGPPRTESGKPSFL